MNSQIVLTVCTVCTLILARYARAEEERSSECKLLIQEALKSYEAEETPDGMLAIQHGTPDLRRCRYLQEKISSECLAEIGMCPFMSETRRAVLRRSKRSSAAPGKIKTGDAAPGKSITDNSATEKSKTSGATPTPLKSKTKSSAPGKYKTNSIAQIKSKTKDVAAGKSKTKDAASGKSKTKDADPGKSKINGAAPRKSETKRSYWSPGVSTLEKECHQPTVDCLNHYYAKYRTFNGMCNNLNYGQWKWGMADRVQARFLPAQYQDGYNAPRTRSSYWPYNPLPSARKVSSIIHEAGTQIQEDPTRSVFVMQFGQFLAHDMLLTGVFTRPDGDPLQCCGEDTGKPECFPISIPADEKYFTPGGCLNFARSRARQSCYTGVRDQVNNHTAYLDLSMVYGVSKAQADDLRTHTGGLLKDVQGKLPKDETDSLCELSMPSDDTNYYCTKAGDPRTSEQPGLTSLHTIWLREHNRLANGLAARHASWSDETLFQEARKIAIAAWQHIVYSEYLPAVIGAATMAFYNMDVTTNGYKDTYSPYTDATIRNAFGVAAFRFGHTLVPDKIALAKVDDESIIQEANLKDHFFEPLYYHVNGHRSTDNILKWTSTKRLPLSDRMMQPSVQRFLFLSSSGSSFDLAAFNIQRGRDHGVPPYNNIREYVCGLPAAKHFRAEPGGLEHHTPEVALLLSQAYNHPDDIDLFTGLLSEKRLSDSLLGHTGQCLLIDQFMRLRNGDRFFYERYTIYPSITFTSDQLNEIKSVHMSTLFCLNTAAKAGKRIPQNMFFVQSASNGYVNCSSIQGINLDKF